MRKQKEEKDFWDKHKNSGLEFSFDKLNIDKSNIGGYSFDKKNLDERENIGDSILERLENNNGIQLEIQKYTIMPIWKNDAGGYFWGNRRCDSSATKKRKQYCKNEIKKSVSITRLIIDIFSTQLKKNQSQGEYILFTCLLTIFQLKDMRKKVKKTQIKL